VVLDFMTPCSSIRC